MVRGQTQVGVDDRNHLGPWRDSCVVSERKAFALIDWVFSGGGSTRHREVVGFCSNPLIHLVREEGHAVIVYTDGRAGRSGWGRNCQRCARNLCVVTCGSCAECNEGSTDEKTCSQYGDDSLECFPVSWR